MSKAKQKYTRNREIWKPVVGFEGSYEVSNLGRVRSLPRRVRYNHKFYMSFRGRVLKTPKRGAHRGGYVGVTLCKLSRAYQRFIHRLVLEAFVGRASHGLQCRHLDGDPSNNCLSNLRWGSVSENCADMLKHGTRMFGEKHHGAKLSDEQIKIIRGSQGRTGGELARRFGVTRTTIYRVKREKNWKHVKFT